MPEEPRPPKGATLKRNIKFNYTIIENEIIDDDTLSGTEKLVYIVLCRHAGNDTEAWPSIETLASKCGAARRTIVSAIANLQTKQLITKKRTNSVNHYFINSPLQSVPIALPNNEQSIQIALGKCPDCTSGSANETREEDTLKKTQEEEEAAAFLFFEKLRFNGVSKNRRTEALVKELVASGMPVSIVDDLSKKHREPSHLIVALEDQKLRKHYKAAGGGNDEPLQNVLDMPDAALGIALYTEEADRTPEQQALVDGWLKQRELEDAIEKENVAREKEAAREALAQAYKGNEKLFSVA